MAHALLRPENDPLFRDRKDLRFTFGRFTYKIAFNEDGPSYSVTDGASSLTLPIKWIFGNEAQTFVLERDGQFFESLISYYPAIGGLDLTVGDQSLRPETIDQAAGRKLEIGEITACFECHSTGSVANRRLNLTSLVPGVACARCHVDAPAHLASMAHTSGAKAAKAVMPEQLGKKSSESISNFCGQCHRSWETVVRNNWHGEGTVRFQPYRLANSPCFNGADSRISCLACHNPHEDLIRNDVTYDVKCLACHSAQGPQTSVNSTARAKTCPVSTSRCTTCHMPKVQLPGGHQVFTDHQIRIVRAGEAYPN